MLQGGDGWCVVCAHLAKVNILDSRMVTHAIMSSGNEVGTA